MRHPRIVIVAALGLVSLSVGTMSIQAQNTPETDGVPTATRWMLDAAGATQRSSMKSVFLMVCPTSQKKGTSFLLKMGVVVTNAHVVKGCTERDLFAMSPLGKRITFSKLVSDSDRDLAILRPSEKLEGGLELGSDDNPALGTAISTWGFPLIYNGPSPLLSVGYVAGYNAVRASGRVVKHIVVNGAFNPGNSGGPLFVSNDNKVIGIVVWKQILFSQTVPTIIEGFKSSKGIRNYGNFSIAQPDGTYKGLSDQEAIAAVLEEFYDTVQVVIGEAISVSELREFLKSKEENLR